MSLDSDVIVDRRRIRRKLTFWRVAAVLIAIAAIVNCTGTTLAPSISMRNTFGACRATSTAPKYGGGTE